MTRRPEHNDQHFEASGQRDHERADDSAEHGADALEVGPPTMRLGDVLKYFGIAHTGGHAKQLIQAGEVRVNGAVETRRKRSVKDGDTVEVGDEAFVLELTPAPEAE